ncbi:hypothetical protein CUT44_04570 [Streptomyces carminius]|uniref:Zinc-finger domain-containing protein n=1 Tax=Streptomyces carminius TaxID=2665496 RepID=A0A2M8M5D6_9ACTN|nr:hypothetical protein [Streptomyces carminius]PJE99427.1 hypothetical protein CUT44_04570 [Streptomyces carminius]
MTTASSASFDTDGHPEINEISALTEGLLPPERSADVRAHLSGCELCTDVRTSLEEIRDALGTLPGPARMPSDVAGRIDAALAAEALLDATTPAGREAASSSSVLPAGVPVGVSRETSPPPRPAGHARGTTGPGRKAHHPFRRRRRVLLATAGAVAVLGFAALFLPGLGAGSSTTAGEQSAADAGDTGDAAARSENTPADDGLEARVRSLLEGGGEPRKQGARRGAEKEGASEFSAESDPSTPLRGEAVTVPMCVREGIGRAEAPLAADRYVHEERQTYLVVLPDETDGARVDAYVVDADCVGSTPPSPGTVLTVRTYER